MRLRNVKPTDDLDDWNDGSIETTIYNMRIAIAKIQANNAKMQLALDGLRAAIEDRPAPQKLTRSERYAQDQEK